MAMTAADLQAKIVAQMNSAFGVPTNAADLSAWALALATAIVEEIQNNAVVNPGSFTNSGGSVTGSGTIS